MKNEKTTPTAIEFIIDYIASDEQFIGYSTMSGTGFKLDPNGVEMMIDANGDSVYLTDTAATLLYD